MVSALTYIWCIFNYPQAQDERQDEEDQAGDALASGRSRRFFLTDVFRDLGWRNGRRTNSGLELPLLLSRVP